MPNENFPAFRDLLRRAICTRTQAQFANETGISVQHLNRMLNAETISRPTKQTLHKIAAAAKNGITFEMLKDALDSEDPGFKPGEGSEEDRQERSHAAAQDFMPDFRARAGETMECLCRVIGGQPYPCVTGDIPGHIEALLGAASESGRDCLPVSYEILGDWPYISGSHSYASRWMVASLSMADSEETAETDMVIFYRDFPGPGQKTYAAIQCVSLAPADIIDVIGMPPAAMEAHRPGPGDCSCDGDAFEAAMGDPYYLEFGETQKFHERFVDTAASSREEALLRQIFGARTEFSETTMGIGFWLDGLPPKFLKFAGRHRSAVLAPFRPRPESLGRLESALDEAIGKDDPAIFTDALAELEYVGTGDNDMGPGACIAEALAASTGFPFVYRRHTDPEDNEQGFVGLSDRDCIILPEADMEKGGIHREPALLAAGRCIQELGLETFGDILFTRMEVRFRKPNTYRLRRLGDAGSLDKAADPGREPDYSVDFGSGVMPKVSGRYAVRLKDGREVTLMYLKEHGIWLARSKEWSYLIEAYDPEPVWLPSDDADGDGAGDGQDGPDRADGQDAPDDDDGREGRDS